MYFIIVMFECLYDVCLVWEPEIAGLPLVLETVAASDHPVELAGGGHRIQFYDSGKPDGLYRKWRSVYLVATEGDPGGRIPVCVHHLHGGAVPVGADAPQPSDRFRLPRLGRLFHLQVVKK